MEQTTTAGLYVGGSWRAAADSFENRSPARPDDVIGVYSAASPTDVDEAYAAARAAAPGWRRTSPLQRAAILYRAASILEERVDAVAAELTREEGKTLAEAKGETTRAVQVLRYFAGDCAQPTGDVLPSVDPRTLLYSVREPLGIVCVITPWNFPIAIPAWKIAPALAYGNTVVFKPAELTPQCAVRLVEALDEAGLPAGVLNLVTGSAARIGEALTRHPEVDAITFTGSNTVGRRIQADATPRGVKVQLEMGGKNPVIVLPDADLGVAVEQTLRGAMWSTGQKCTATSRAILHADVADRFTERLLARARTLRVGDPMEPDTDLGPLVSEPHMNDVLGHIERAEAAEHELLMGGHRDIAAGSGWFVAPTVVGGVGRDAALAREEVFGPVLALMTADSVEEAIAIANATEYGLSASVFTRDLATAFEFVREVHAGVVHVNSETAGAEPQAPFGGVKASSSHSREQGKAAAQFFTETKTAYVTA